MKESPFPVFSEQQDTPELPASKNKFSQHNSVPNTNNGSAHSSYSSHGDKPPFLLRCWSSFSTGTVDAFVFILLRAKCYKVMHLYVICFLGCIGAVAVLLFENLLGNGYILVLY